MLGTQARRIRHVGALLVPLTTAIIAWLVLVQRAFPPFTPTPSIIVCGDFSSEHSFAPGVYREARKFSRPTRSGAYPPFNVVKLDDEEDASTGRFRQSFLDLLSRKHVIAVVSANTTQNVPPLLRLAQAFRLPVLIAVATNDRLLAGEAHTALRLVPNDTDQAQAITKWADNFKHVLVWYHDSDYGDFLSRKVSAFLSAKGILTLRLMFTTEPDAMLTFSPMSDFTPEAVIYAGYYTGAPDVVRALCAYGASAPLLLSDGCYSANLCADVAHYPGPTYLSFPIDPFSEGSGQSSGFGSFGHDAAVIIAEALAEAAEANLSREKFISAIRRVLDDGLGDEALLRSTYRFTDDSGRRVRQNLDAHFQVIPIPRARRDASTQTGRDHENRQP